MERRKHSQYRHGAAKSTEQQRNIHGSVLMFAAILLLQMSEVGALRQTYSEVYTYDDTAKDEASFTLNQDNALNLCPCDVTRGSCDAYCCCDLSDCEADVVAFWKENYNTYCEVNAINKQYKSKYSACVDQMLLKKWNAVDGMTVTERDGQACVTLNIPSSFSEYKEKVDPAKYIEDQAALDPDYLDLMVAQETYNARKYSTYQAFYKEGDQVMRQTQQRPAVSAPQPTTFFLSQAVGLNGYCSNGIGIGFMMDVDHDNSCTQAITDLKKAAESFLDYETYYSVGFGTAATTWGLAAGIATATPIEVTLGEVWKLDANNILTNLKKASDATPANPTWATKYSRPGGSTGPCQVEFALKEAYYEVRYTPAIDASTANSEESGYKISSATVNIVLQDVLKFEGAAQEKYCEAAGDALLSGVKLTQTFGVKFKPEVTAQKDEFYRSGNPGYQTEFPLIIGQEPDIAKPQIVAKEGTRLFSDNENGECYEGTAVSGQHENFGPKILRFEQHTQLTCIVKKNQADLQKYCDGADKDEYKKLKIFKQLTDKLQYVSQFGSPSLTKQKDWIKIVRSADSAKKWDATTSTCSGVIGYDIKFLYSSLGFRNQLQKYIVGAKIEEIKEDWTYYNKDGDPATTQAFSHIVQVSYHEASNESLQGNEVSVSWLFPKVPGDIFYPFTMES